MAQLGARLNGIQEAEGSSPFISIKEKKPPTITMIFGGFLCSAGGV